MVKRNICLFLLVALCVSCIFATCTSAFAEDVDVYVADLDNTDVLADLMTSDTFSVDNYSFDIESTSPPELISFVEYCYSNISSYSSLYGIYLYLFNPSGYVLDSAGHSINIATVYVGNKPVQYETFQLELLDISDNQPGTDKITYNMFWKFKVVDKKSSYNGLTIQQRVNASARQYDVVGIQLQSSSTDNIFSNTDVKDFQIGCSYTYSGYANGMSTTTNTPLTCSQQELDTVTLDVNSTYYRSQTSNKGNGWHNDVNSVYFSVPKSFFNKYGELKRIKAEWYEFETEDIVVTSNSDFYNSAKKYVGKDVYTGASDYGMQEVGYALVENYLWPTVTWSWNTGDAFKNQGPGAGPITTKKLYYLFNTSIIQGYDSSKGLLEQGGVSGEKLEKYIASFASDYSDVAGETFTIGNNTYSKNLFSSDISDSRKIDNAMGTVQCGFDGKSIYEFDVDIDTFSYSTWDWSQGSYWENVSMMDGENWAWWHALWGNLPEEEEELSNIKYIMMVDENDLSLSKADFCKKYLINSYDYDSFISYCRQELYAEREVVLFRFAVTDYYSNMLTIYKNFNGWFDELQGIEDQAYRAFGSVFLDFDIIQLTFKDDSGYHAIGVVADPINIFPDVTPPVQIEVTEETNDVFSQFFTMIIFLVLALVVWSVIKEAIKTIF